MSLDTKNQKCAVCSAYLFDEDDIVYCPVCGAPHHRECYLSIGKCGLEEFHGTEKEYKKPEESETPPPENNAPPKNDNPYVRRCRSCGMPLDEGSHVCTNCGMPKNMGSMPFGAGFEMPVIDPNVPIEEGVTAGEAAGIVRTNTFRYIPKFLGLNKKRKGSWNWAAFLLPYAWFAFRKMYKESVITTLLFIATVLMNLPLTVALAQLPAAPTGIQNYLQLGQHYAQYIDSIGILPLALSFAGVVIGILVRIISGIYGDYIYKQRVITSASIVKNAEDKDAAKRKYAGTSFIGFFLAVLAFEFIPSVISIFLL